MIRAELGSLFARKLRTALTILAILLGVSMISGTYILTDTISAAFGQIFSQANAHIDAVVSGKALIPGEFAPSPPVPARLLSIVAKTPGVKTADGDIVANGAQLYGPLVKEPNGVVKRTAYGSTGGAPNLVFAVQNQSFDQLTLVNGRWPTHWEVALDTNTMDRNKLKLGQAVGVVTANHALRTFKIVGTTRFGISGSIGGATLIDMSLRPAQIMTGEIGKFDRISTRAIHGVSQKTLANRIRARLPASLKSRLIVRTGTQEAAHSASQISTALNFLKIALLAFAGIAVFVGAFIIFNTFSITVAQRAREFALFRTLGSSRGQILRSVVVEALIIGLTAAIIGLFAGFGIAKGLNGLFQTIGADLPSTGLILARRTVIVALLVGTIVTIFAALMPALRATRVPPIAAMREGATLPKGKFSRWMPVIASLVAIMGLLLTVFGVFGSIDSSGFRLLIIGLGCILLFVGVAMLSPKAVVPLAAVLGWPMERMTRVTGRMARDNAMRNPSRTASTAAALMIGLALVAFVTILAAELKKTADDTVSREVAGSLIVQDSATQRDSIQPGAVRQIGRVPGVALASPLAEDVSRVVGIGRTRVDGIVASNFGQVYRFQWKQGGPTSLATMTSHDALISDSFASANHLAIGSRFRLQTPANVYDSFTVHGIFKSSSLLDDIVIPNITFSADWHQKNAVAVVINLTPGANQATVENRLANTLSVNYPQLSVTSQQQFKAQEDSQVNSLLALIYVLLGLSIIVSLFGIINTLVLSIYERTREIGMLRAIGTTRTQIRWMIRWESVITSLIGAVLGLFLGIALAILVTLGLQSDGIEFSLPIGQLLIFLVFAIFFGIVAAMFPARRAARLDVLKAVAYE